MGLKPVYIRDMHRSINPLKDFSAYRQIRKIIEEFKPDIVHTHAAKSGTLGRLAAYLAGVPVILYTFHRRVFHSYFNPLKTKLFLSIERYLALKSSKIIAISNKQKEELCNEYEIAPSNKFAIVPLGFGLDRFFLNNEQKRRDFRQKYGLFDTDIAIGIIGRLVPVKNHSLFLTATTHVDGTARPQVVTAEANPSYHKIITEYFKLSGIPVIINTSFNMHEEPIVTTPNDAIRSFQQGCLDYLAIGNYLCEYR